MLYNCSGSELVLIASAISIEIANCSTDEELELLSALYTVIGDQLALIAVKRGSDAVAVL